MERSSTPHRVRQKPQFDESRDIAQEKCVHRRRDPADRADFGHTHKITTCRKILSIRDEKHGGEGGSIIQRGNTSSPSQRTGLEIKKKTTKRREGKNIFTKKKKKEEKLVKLLRLYKSKLAQESC